MRSLAIAALTVTLIGCRPNPAEESVRQVFADPDSVQFRDVRKCAADSTLTTGVFNAKNAFGAYVGFQPFVVEYDFPTFDGFGNLEQMLARCNGTQYIEYEPLERISAKK